MSNFKPIQPGVYSETLEVFESLHDMEDKELGEKQPTTLTIKHNIGNTLSMLGQNSEALETFN